VVGFDRPETKTVVDAGNVTWEKPQKTKTGQRPVPIVIWVDMAVTKVFVQIAL
jgi:hypothetical protein